MTSYLLADPHIRNCAVVVSISVAVMCIPLFAAIFSHILMNSVSIVTICYEFVNYY